MFPGITPGPTYSHSTRNQNKSCASAACEGNVCAAVAWSSAVTYSVDLNLSGMRGTIFLLVLSLISIATAGRAQGNPNHLSEQTSPYLKRAVSQPVDWYPWGAEAFQRAKELNRPILLDVGAVWCPWCTLMDRETYTKVATADYVNQHFVSVKVDFDAAPELVPFITPDGKLYFGAGYLPAEHKGDKPSFREAAEEAVKRYTDKRKVDEESFQLEVAK